MTKLEKLYSIIENSRDVGIKLNKDVLQQVEELEEGIIKEEILPALGNDIAPRLDPIKRDLVLVVEYHPGEPISVALSRKTKISEIMGAKIMQIDPKVEHSSGGKKTVPIMRSGRTGLVVTFPDGTVVADKPAKAVFVDTIQYIGAMKVRALGLTMCKVPLVSNTLDEKYGHTQEPVGDGFYVMTHSNTTQKKRMLEKISQQLSLNLKVEVFNPQ